MNVLLVTSWSSACGIAEHSALLKQAVEAADPDIRVLPDEEALDPGSDSVRSLIHDTYLGIDLVHLNYQAGLLSRWTPDVIRRLQGAGHRVLVTYHDTGVPNSAQCQAIAAVADAMVVHEPFDDLPPEKTYYWRMGIPAWIEARRSPLMDLDERPVVGTIGFPFPWKNYRALIVAAHAAGWRTLLIAPGASVKQIDEWTAGLENPGTIVYTEWLPRDEALALLGGCHATAFTYVTHNTGQSGALLYGVATRRPVLALSTCRQFRALYEDPLGRTAILWCDTFETVTETLRELLPPTGTTYTDLINGYDLAVMSLADQDSWQRLGREYAALYRRLAG